MVRAQIHNCGCWRAQRLKRWSGSGLPCTARLAYGMYRYSVPGKLRVVISQCVVPFSVAIDSVGTNCSVPWSSHRRWVPSKKTRRCYQYHRMLPPYATRGGSTGTLCDTTLFEVRATHTWASHPQQHTTRVVSSSPRRWRTWRRRNGDAVPRRRRRTAAAGLTAVFPVPP